MFALERGQTRLMGGVSGSGEGGDRISLCNSLGCLRTHFANQVGPEFIKIGLSLSAGIKGMQRRVPSLRCTLNAGNLGYCTSLNVYCCAQYVHSMT